MQRNSFTEQVNRDSYADPHDDVTVTVGANGAATVSFNYNEGASQLDGFFNEDASIGIFTNRYISDNDNESDRIGMAILVEVD